MKRSHKNIGTGRGLYRSRNGVIFGVCRGVADFFDFSVFWARAIAVVLLFVTGLWPIVGIYILAALLMKPEPVIPIEPEGRNKISAPTLASRCALSRNEPLANPTVKTISNTPMLMPMILIAVRTGR